MERKEKMKTEFKRSVHEMTTEITACIRDAEIASLFDPKEILIIARNRMAITLADKFSEKLMPLLDKAIKEMDFNNTESTESEPL